MKSARRSVAASGSWCASCCGGIVEALDPRQLFVTCKAEGSHKDGTMLPLLTASPPVAEDGASPGLPWFTKGDVEATGFLLFNNLATFLSATQLLASAGPESESLVRETIYPAFGISMFFGCIYYVLQAVHASRTTGRSDLCSQPFGINTPGTFAVLSGIFLPLVANGTSPSEAFRVMLSCNLICGLCTIALAALGPMIMELAIPVALLASLSSIGLAFLIVNTMIQGFGDSCIVFIVSLFVLLVGWLGQVQMGRVPVVVVVLVLGSSIAWIQGHLDTEGVFEAADSLQWTWPQMHTSSLSKGMAAVPDYMGLVVPIAISVALGTIQCNSFARNAGDAYSVRMSMLGDGLATTLAALLGSPFSMTVYIGHPACKRMGASIGYNIVTGCFFFIAGFVGLFPLVLSVVSINALNPVIVFIGIAVCLDPIDVIPRDHFPSFFIALVPALANWCLGAAWSIADFYADPASLPDALDINTWKDAGGASLGLFLLGQGYIVTSIAIAAMLAHASDRDFVPAAAWSVFAALSSLFGLMHNSKLAVLTDEDDYGWRLAVAYSLCGVTFIVFKSLQHLGFILPQKKHAKQPEGIEKEDGNQNTTQTEKDA